jgi:hypothetical protein
MAERIQARDLLNRARAVFDTPASPLARLAAAAWKGGFASGGLWMQQGLVTLRGTPGVRPVRGLNALGLIKYGLAGSGALLCVAVATLLAEPLVLILCVPVFYAIEAQMVFLFPLVFDGSERPFRDARRWTVRAGGTVAVMRVVLPIAFTMLFGGFGGRGFIRSWCIGCLAVCVWYEVLHAAQEPCPVGSTTVPG